MINSYSYFIKIYNIEAFISGCPLNAPRSLNYFNSATVFNVSNVDTKAIFFLCENE